jgi:hypothetical protein
VAEGVLGAARRLVVGAHAPLSPPQQAVLLPPQPNARAACRAHAGVTPTQVDRAKVLSNTIKQKRKEKAGKWEVPLPKVRSLAQLCAGGARSSAVTATPCLGPQQPARSHSPQQHSCHHTTSLVLSRITRTARITHMNDT